MRHFFYLFLFIVMGVIFSCRGTKNATRNDEKDLASLIKRINKKGGDERTIFEIQQVYNDALQKSTARLNNFYYDPLPDKWEKVVQELEGLQRMYDIINQSAYAMRMVTPVNYYQQLLATKDSAASWYYHYGEEQMQQQNRQSYRYAYDAFQRTRRFVPNYRNAQQLANEAYERSIVNVLLNNFQFDDYSLNSWGYSQFGNANKTMHDRLIRDLGAQSASYVPARFFNDYDLRRSNLAPEMVIDLVWKNIQFDYPRDKQTTYNRSKKIETGKDTANKPIYQTVTATVYVTRREFNADSYLNIIVTDANTRQQIKWEQLPSSYRYYYEFAEYRGDQRALDNNDLTLINRSRTQQPPTKEIAMNEMMQKVYSSLVSRLKQLVSW